MGTHWDDETKSGDQGPGTTDKVPRALRPTRHNTRQKITVFPTPVSPDPKHNGTGGHRDVDQEALDRGVVIEVRGDGDVPYEIRYDGHTYVLLEEWQSLREAMVRVAKDGKPEPRPRKPWGVAVAQWFLIIVSLAFVLGAFILFIG